MNSNANGFRREICGRLLKVDRVRHVLYVRARFISSPGIRDLYVDGALFSPNNDLRDSTVNDHGPKETNRIWLICMWFMDLCGL